MILLRKKHFFVATTIVWVNINEYIKGLSYLARYTLGQVTPGASVIVCEAQKVMQGCRSRCLW